jgi:hypothetical protein
MHEASRKSTMLRFVKMRITRTGEIGPEGPDAANSQLSELARRSGLPPVGNALQLGRSTSARASGSGPF